MPKQSVKYAIVQHSAMGYKGDTGFLKGLETASCNATESKAVTKAGGLLFDNWGEADQYCLKEMYPATVLGMYPQAPGSFSKLKINSLSVYIPVKQKEKVGA